MRRQTYLWVLFVALLCLASSALAGELVIAGIPSATESITVSTAAIGVTAGLCGQAGKALVNVRTNGVFATLHSATATPSTANGLEWKADTMVVIDQAPRLRMIRSGGVDAQVIIVCLSQ